MTNESCAVSGRFGLSGLKLRAISRTILLRYPGYGNSIPCVRTETTSVPRPPVGPPPAFGDVSARGLFAAGSVLGVAFTGCLRGGGVFFAVGGAGMASAASTGRVGAGGEGAGVGSGVAAGGVTTPA